MFMFPMTVEKDGESIRILDRADLARFVNWASLYLEMTQHIQNDLPVIKGATQTTNYPNDSITAPAAEVRNSKALSLRRAERIHEVGLQLGVPFVARDIANVVSSEQLFKSPSGNPVHIIRGAMREHPKLFAKMNDGTGASFSKPLSGVTTQEKAKKNGHTADGETNMDRIGRAVEVLDIRTKAELRARVKDVVEVMDSEGWPTRAESLHDKKETVLTTVRRYGSVLFGEDNTDADDSRNDETRQQKDGFMLDYEEFSPEPSS